MGMLIKILCLCLFVLMFVYFAVVSFRSKFRSVKETKEEKYYSHCIDLYFKRGDTQKLYQYVQRIVKQRAFSKLLIFQTPEFDYSDDELFSITKYILFFASTFWTKLQNIFGHCCMSKLDKVAKRWPVVLRLAI